MYSMQCGSFDVGVSCRLLARLPRLLFVVPAPVVAAFPFPSCGLAFSAELQLYPVFWFQSWNFGSFICYLSPEMVSHWTFLCVPWTLDCFSWIQSGGLSRLVATVGCMRAAALFVVRNLLIVDLFSPAAAFGGLFNQVTVLAAAAAAAAIVVVHAPSSLDESAAGANADEILVFIVQAAVAAAAAIVVVHALSSLYESAAGAKNDEFLVCVVQAAAAWVAATVAVHSLCKSSLVVFFFAGCGSWISLWVCSSFPGLWKEQRNISLQGKDEEASNLQALIPGASCVEGLAFDDLFDTFKGKDRHDTDGSLSLGSGEASGRVEVPVSVKKLVDQAIRSPQSVVVNQSLRVEKTIFMKGWMGAPRLTGYLRAR